MYGMPDSSALSKVVFELCHVHPRTVGEHTGLEAPLLEMLRQAIASDTSGAYGGGSSRTGAPVDTNALTIWEGIRDTVGQHWPGRGDLARAGTPLITRLEVWTASLAGSDEELHLLEMCHYWRGQIRDLLEPPQEVPLRGLSCPTCKQDRVLMTDPDGGSVYQPPLLAYLSETPIRVTCRGCTGTWEGQDLHYLGAAAEFLGQLV